MKIETTVNALAAAYSEWISTGADNNDVQKLASEWYGVEENNVTVEDDGSIVVYRSDT